jgi:PilZ domain
MGMERRGVQRKRPVGISYFQFEAGSGGIVLDASEKGLAFQSADAIQRLGPSRLCISPRPEQRIEVRGDVIWTDRSRKNGGLRFVEQGPETTRQIREWLKQSCGPETSERNAEFPWPSSAVHGAHGGQRHGSPTSSSSAAGPRPRTETRENEAPGPRPLDPWPPLFTADLPWQSPDFQPASRRFLRNVATGFLTGVLVLTSVVLFADVHLVEKLRPKIADSLIHLGERLNGNANLQPAGSSPSAGAAPVPARATSGAESTVEAPTQETPDDTHWGLGPSGQNDVPTSEPETASTKQTAEHSVKRRKVRLARERSEQAMQLWAAVGAGDSRAEVNLARLYMKGEGVPRNCEQARILLRAAAKSGNREARQQLLKLRTSGCP